ncbi:MULTISPECIES: hypothetical protein [Pseudomonadaceae]|jgi:hypothetical protein|uniref:Uncharacterized protein n=2 Tax=Pseudomonas TaxID=286 RepID=A0A7Y8ATL7_PSETO|nr:MULTISPECIES: hypothetical protein [Pseudomonadaceae]MBF4560329.1 hypothetical protein [Pseudomonas sp. p50(2008)]MBF6043587.1 hypothetical protein [Pseudomonas mucoides]MBK3915704.1 hypothetical protein [Stutzerimonas frequens]MBX9410531.1 hypothetical protein [Pseudomonas baetica]MCT8950798.1 hypothetical protein [Pseudomonas iridis]
MKLTIGAADLESDVLLREALTAYRTYKEADESGVPLEEVRKLGLLFESLIQGVIDSHFLVAGLPPSTIH